MEFKQGNPISVLLSDYLKEYTTVNERADVAAKTGVGTSTIRDLIYRTTSVTETNTKAIVALIELAVVNCTNKIEYGKKARKNLNSQLQAV